LYEEQSDHRQPTTDDLEAYDRAYNEYLDAYAASKKEIAGLIREQKMVDPKAQVTLDKKSLDPPILTPSSSLHYPWNGPQSEPKNATWTWPATEREIVQYNVFKELWSKGFYISRGSKFGGDYLLYPGDPSRYHSNYVATVALPRQRFSALDAISLGRLGTSVKKTHVVCSWTPEKGLITVCIDWTGWS
jgi:tRNA-splicing endonuclease subunit Sen34